MATFPHGTEVTLTTDTIVAGDVFDRWEGNNPCAGTSSPTCSVTMDADHDATAIFVCAGT